MLLQQNAAPDVHEPLQLWTIDGHTLLFHKVGHWQDVVFAIVARTSSLKVTFAVIQVFVGFNPSTKSPSNKGWGATGEDRMPRGDFMPTSISPGDWSALRGFRGDGVGESMFRANDP